MVIVYNVKFGETKPSSIAKGKEKLPVVKVGGELTMLLGCLSSTGP